jgi:hypothetical protein
MTDLTNEPAPQIPATLGATHITHRQYLNTELIPLFQQAEAKQAVKRFMTYDLIELALRDRLELRGDSPIFTTRGPEDYEPFNEGLVIDATWGIDTEAKYLDKTILLATTAGIS